MIQINQGDACILFSPDLTLDGLQTDQIAYTRIKTLFVCLLSLNDTLTILVRYSVLINKFSLITRSIAPCLHICN